MRHVADAPRSYWARVAGWEGDGFCESRAMSLTLHARSGSLASSLVSSLVMEKSLTLAGSRHFHATRGITRRR